MTATRTTAAVLVACKAKLLLERWPAWSLIWRGWSAWYPCAWARGREGPRGGSTSWLRTRTAPCACGAATVRPEAIEGRLFLLWLTALLQNTVHAASPHLQLIISVHHSCPPMTLLHCVGRELAVSKQLSTSWPVHLGRPVAKMLRMWASSELGGLEAC